MYFDLNVIDIGHQVFVIKRQKLRLEPTCVSYIFMISCNNNGYLTFTRLLVLLLNHHVIPFRRSHSLIVRIHQVFHSFTSILNYKTFSFLVQMAFLIIILKIYINFFIFNDIIAQHSFFVWVEITFLYETRDIYDPFTYKTSF